MKTIFNKSILLMTLVSMASILSSCGGNKNSDSQTAQACSVGYYYYNNQCFPINGTGTSVNAAYNYTSGFYADNYSGTTTLRVVNGAKLKQFFKFGMGVCDRAATNYGQASCDAYVGGQMDVIIQFPNQSNSSMLTTFIARPKYNPYGNYSAQLPSGWGLLGIALGAVSGVYLPDPHSYNGAYRNPLQLEMAVSAINNSTGFEARGYGDYWTGANTTLLAIQVPQGKVEDNQFNFNFLVSGQVAAQGSMKRCQTMNCGL